MLRRGKGQRLFIGFTEVIRDPSDRSAFGLPIYSMASRRVVFVPTSHLLQTDPPKNK